MIEQQGDLWDGGYTQGDLFEDPPEEEPQVEVTDEEE